MKQDGRVQIGEVDLPRESDMDLARFSMAIAAMLLCGIGLLWWNAIQYNLMAPARPILAAVLCGGVAMVGLATVTLSVRGAIRGFLFKIPALKIADGRISGFYFSAFPLEAVEAIHVVKRRVLGLSVEELHIGVHSTGKTHVVPVWILEKSARLHIHRAIVAERSAI